MDKAIQILSKMLEDSEKRADKFPRESKEECATLRAAISRLKESRNND